MVDCFTLNQLSNQHTDIFMHKCVDATMFLTKKVADLKPSSVQRDCMCCAVSEKLDKVVSLWKWMSDDLLQYHYVITCHSAPINHARGVEGWKTANRLY